MGKEDTQFKKGNKNRRGKAERTKILEAMKRVNKSEEEFYDYLVNRAFNPEDNFGAPELLRRIAPIPKQTLPLVEFPINPDSSLSNQAKQIVVAVGNGLIPPDIAKSLIDSISTLTNIETNTELKDEIEAIKKMLGSQ